MFVNRDQFDQLKPTKFVWHGWNGRSSSHYATKDVILDNVDANVFVVNWPGATDLIYLQVHFNYELFFFQIIDHNLTPKRL